MKKKGKPYKWRKQRQQQRPEQQLQGFWNSYHPCRLTMRFPYRILSQPRSSKIGSERIERRVRKERGEKEESQNEKKERRWMNVCVPRDRKIFGQRSTITITSSLSLSLSPPRCTLSSKIQDIHDMGTKNRQKEKETVQKEKMKERKKKKGATKKV